MKVIQYIFALIMSSLVLSSCLFDSGIEWKDEKYHVAWIDTDENRSLYATLENNAGLGQIDPTIISVGSDDLYVVAKRRPENGPVQYYYIEKGPDRNYPGDGDRKFGPFTATQFLSLKDELNLPSFEKNFK